jgi:DeoR family ulaG and ulaABCDEF operon transcriptional repressor
LAGLNLQVLTNSLHIVSALLLQSGTRLLVPAGQVFPEQNIILTVAGDDGMSRFHAPKLFMGAASLGPAGLMQADIILVAAERRLIERADEIIVLIDSSKFEGPSGHVVCHLDEIDTVVTDNGISQQHTKMLQAAGVRVVIADS